MPVNNGQSGGDDFLHKSAYSALTVLKRNLALRSYTLTAAQEEATVIHALAWHGGHVLLIGIQQTQLDPFKLTCWLGGTIIKVIEKDSKKHEAISDSIIDTLEEIMFEETRGDILLADSDRELLRRMLEAERVGKCDLGIGFNGLYCAFHFACAASKSLRSRRLIKEPPEAQQKPKAIVKEYPEPSPKQAARST